MNRTIIFVHDRMTVNKNGPQDGTHVPKYVDADNQLPRLEIGAC
jgi:hypothetical protein